MSQPGFKLRDLALLLVIVAAMVLPLACKASLWNGEAYKPTPAKGCSNQDEPCRNGLGEKACCNAFYCKGGDSEAGGRCVAHGM